MDLENNQNVQNENNVAAVGDEEPPEDFRTLTIVPTVEDLNNDNIFLRAAKIKEKYNSVDHYLDVQFRLLREDFLTPLRRGLDDYLTYVGKKGHKNNDLRIYRKVKLIPVEKGVGIKASFGILSYINWQQSKRLMHGGLLMLSNDNFQTILFVTVGNRDTKELEQGLVSITLCDEKLKITKQMYDAEYVMLESKIFFEPYMAVLSAMKQINDDNFPMKNYLIEASNVINSPAYLRQIGTLKYKNFNLPLHDAGHWPTAQQLGLDETQYNAFRHALTEEFALIQGPPGTGKTFIALEIVRTLLQNKSCWKSFGPIVVVCYTNHALDQFLEGILKHTNSIVRIGGQSKSDVLKPYTLVNKRKDPNRTRNGKYSYIDLRDAKDKLEDIEIKLQSFRWYIKKLSTQDIILPLKDITKHYNDPEVAKIKCNRDFLQWLFQEVAPQTLQSCQLPGNVESFVYKYVEDPVIEDFEHFSPVTNLNSKLLTLDEYSQYLNMLEMKPEIRNYIIIQLNHYRRKLNQQIQQLKNQFAHQPLQQQPRRNHQHRLPELNNRWRIYWNLVRRHYYRTIDSIARLETSHRRLNSEINEMRNLLDIDIFEAHKIIGLTTTSAARLYNSLRNLTAPIVLVEEAAEIFETHVVSSMTKHCQHVILIGDHKQLQPKTSTYEIGKKYNLSISLFERMINIRGGSCPQLAYQHRMRPEIAQLITPSIYEVLHNHESVNEHADVKGLEKNLFFLDHNNPETSCDNESSWSNEFEAKFLIAFAIHLVKQGYQTNDITILCTYTGQLFLLRKERGKHTILQGTFITTVDNYQGEENKIILLSLVRNNGEGKVGFLKEENRVCVALSRAREGLFVMGNMSDLVIKNNIWPQIKHVLQQQHAIGDCIEVRCQIHPEVLYQIRKFEDFNELCPEGGCLRKCQSVLNCGHVCTKTCHVLDKEHEDYKCMEKCTKSCPFNHPCKRKCWQDCGACPEMVERKLDQCGHTVKMPCSSDPEKFPCYIQIDVTLPDCEHEMTKACALPIEKCVCPHDCDNRLLCGHMCSQKCHVKKDPDHLEYQCFKECAKIYQDCENNHPCKKRCYEDCGKCPVQVDKRRSCDHYYKKAKCSVKIDEQPCIRPCKRDLPCGHKCPMKCSDLCGNCKIVVTKDSTCGHKIKVKCSEEATPLKCNGRCSKKLPHCGHLCTNRCKDACTVKCEAAVKLCRPGLCGHIFSVPCYLQGNDPENPSLLKYCKEPCRTTLECQHRCSGNCGECLQGRIHKPCSAPCQKILVCGHQCDIPCKKDCQPCTRKCEIRCSHSKCKQKCGYPCITCKEKCKIGCIHRQCSKRCDEICNIEPCNEPCPKVLKCGHACVGFCGDPCPPLCRICNKDELTEIFFGTEEETDARFVFLKDCQHTIESEGLMDWMKSSTDESNKSVSIGMKRCPKCSTEIKDCMRISNQIKAHLQDVLLVKKRIYAKNLTEKQLKEEQLKHVGTLNNFLKNDVQLKEFEELHDLMQDMLKRGALTNKTNNNRRRQILSMPELNAFKLQLDILTHVSHVLSTSKHKGIPLFTIVKDHIKMLARSMPNSWFITAQTLDDIQLEIQRLSYMVALCNLGHTTCSELEPVKALMLSPQKFTSAVEEQLKIKIKDLEKIINGKITIEERQMIVKAIGLTQGHWFKCPNGHIYAIGDCGGATQVGRCNECNERIGGSSHQLLPSNALATEMDGATRPAWPTGMHY